ncbi:MAG TPA: SAM-dependent methyltransferase [Streptosporangiaceae bacterium]|nr:SAM-dependent methyltransferase [Streptosporangiaceae bacterium]
MFRRRAPRHGLTATVPAPHAARPAAPPAASGAPGAGRDPGGPPPAGLDVSTAHPARVWNYWLGGRDYFAADRAAGEQISREFPHLAQTARAERAFLVRAVRFLAGPARIRQFLDIGAGLPAGGNTHEIAQRIAPDTGIVYADNDPAVLVHARALLQTPMLASTPEGTVSYVDADLRDVTAVLAGSARTLDLQRPVALIMLGVLGHLDDHGAARSITSQLMDALPSGSYLAIADGVAGTGPVSQAQQRYNDAAALPYHLRRPDELASFFDGLDLIEPGVVPCPRWKPDGSGHAASAQEEAAAYCGVARKRLSARNRRLGGVLRNDPAPTRMIGGCLPGSPAPTLGS